MNFLKQLSQWKVNPKDWRVIRLLTLNKTITVDEKNSYLDLEILLKILYGRSYDVMVRYSSTLEWSIAPENKIYREYWQSRMLCRFHEDALQNQRKLCSWRVFKSFIEKTLLVLTFAYFNRANGFLIT